jgi:hypothetical protein
MRVIIKIRAIFPLKCPINEKENFAEVILKNGKMRKYLN